jgi:hypothetical protein
LLWTIWACTAGLLDKKHLISINVYKIFDKATRKMLLRLRKENSKKICIFWVKHFHGGH